MVSMPGIATYSTGIWSRPYLYTPSHRPRRKRDAGIGISFEKYLSLRPARPRASLGAPCAGNITYMSSRRQMTKEPVWQLPYRFGGAHLPAALLPPDHRAARAWTPLRPASATLHSWRTDPFATRYVLECLDLTTQATVQTSTFNKLIPNFSPLILRCKHTVPPVDV